MTGSMARVVDLAKHPGVYATRLLAEVGHEVIRVEPPQGDELRRLGPYLGDVPDVERGAYHHFFNAGKRSLTLDLEHPSGWRVFLDLVGSAHVVVVSQTQNLDARVLVEANPRLVLVEVEDGEPELCAFARSGLLSLTGHPARNPVVLGGHVVYAATGLSVAMAAAAAMLVQQLTGRGQVVKVSVQQCMESLAEQAMVSYTSTGKVAERSGYRGAITAASGAFACADGYWMVSIPHTPQGWKNLMEWMDDPILRAEPSLEDEADRREKQDLIMERLAAWSRGLSKAELVEEAQRRHIPASPVDTTLDLIDDPQLVARGFLAETDHLLFGHTLWPVGAIACLNGVRLGAAPRLGQHNAEILAELGYSPADHQALVESGAM